MCAWPLHDGRGLLRRSKTLSEYWECMPSQRKKLRKCFSVEVTVAVLKGLPPRPELFDELRPEGACLFDVEFAEGLPVG